MRKLDTKGFTLIELLIVIAIIGILAFVVFIALNPLGRFQDARNSDRVQNVENIGKAVLQYNVDNNGSWPTGIPALTSSTYTSGFNAGVPQCTPTGVTVSNHGVGQGCEWADDSVLSPLLTPKYLSAVPDDTAYASSSDLYHYYVALTPAQDHVVVMNYGFEAGVNTNNGSSPFNTTNPYYRTF
jgi:prepilin-type N-terminal cleavage/methylation domain-containing protein